MLATGLSRVHWRALLAEGSLPWVLRSFLSVLRAGLAKAPFTSACVILILSGTLSFQAGSVLFATLVILRIASAHNWDSELALVRRWKRENGITQSALRKAGAPPDLQLRQGLWHLARQMGRKEFELARVDVRTYLIILLLVDVLLRSSEGQTSSPVIFGFAALLALWTLLDILNLGQALRREGSVPASQEHFWAFIWKRRLRCLVGLPLVTILTWVINRGEARAIGWIATAILGCIFVAESHSLLNEQLSFRALDANRKANPRHVIDPVKAKIHRGWRDMGFTSARARDYPMLKLVYLRADLGLGDVQHMLNIATHLDLMLTSILVTLAWWVK